MFVGGRVFCGTGVYALPCLRWSMADCFAIHLGIHRIVKLRGLLHSMAVGAPLPHGCGCQNQSDSILVGIGEFTTHFRAFFWWLD